MTYLQNQKAKIMNVKQTTKTTRKIPKTSDSKIVMNGEQATETAMKFLQKNFPFRIPLKAKMEDKYWFVEIDVGALSKRIAKIKIDANNGEILEYEIPN